MSASINPTFPFRVMDFISIVSALISYMFIHVCAQFSFGHSFARLLPPNIVLRIAHLVFCVWLIVVPCIMFLDMLGIPRGRCFRARCIALYYVCISQDLFIQFLGDSVGFSAELTVIAWRVIFGYFGDCFSSVFPCWAIEGPRIAEFHDP